MTDFLITMMTLYPWFAWLLVFLAAVGIGYGSLWLAGGIMFVSSWVQYRRAVWHWKAAVRRSGEDGGYLCPSCAVIADKVMTGDDPPEYQHPDGDDDGLADWDGPPDDWSPAAEWGEKPRRVLGTAVDVMAAAWGLNDDDQLPDGPPVELWGKADNYDEIVKHPDALNRCANRDCFRYGEDHAGACDVAPTMPAACYTEGPAMPPQPVREYLHPAIMDDLKAAGFSEHETNEGAVESSYTRAMAREVQAMASDGVIPSDETGRSHPTGERAGK